MPYSVAGRGKNLLVTSTFSSRVAEVSFSKKNMKIVRDWYSTGNRKLNKRFTTDQSEGSMRTVAFQNNPYSSVCLMPTWLPGLTCALAGLVNDTQSKFLRFPNPNSILSRSSYFYFVKSFGGRSAHDTYFLAASSPNILNLRLVDRVPYLLLFTYEVGLEPSGDVLVNSARTIQEEQVRAEFDKQFMTLASKRNKSGIVPLQDAAPILMPDKDAAELLHSRLRESIDASKSAAGEKFLNDYLNCKGNVCDGDYLGKDAIAFAKRADEGEGRPTGPPNPSLHADKCNMRSSYLARSSPKRLTPRIRYGQ